MSLALEQDCRDTVHHRLTRPFHLIIQLKVPPAVYRVFIKEFHENIKLFSTAVCSTTRSAKNIVTYCFDCSSSSLSVVMSNNFFRVVFISSRIPSNLDSILLSMTSLISFKTYGTPQHRPQLIGTQPTSTIVRFMRSGTCRLIERAGETVSGD